jgi:diguanylate cyclase (GGDEF)-like protein
VSGTDEIFEELRREYLTDAPLRLAELRKDLAALRAGEDDAAASLKTRFHRLAGSGGSYGFPEISSTSRAAERLLVEHPTPGPEVVARLEAAIVQVAGAFDAAASQLGLPTAPTKRPAFAWRALIVGDNALLVSRIERALADARYEVSRRPADADPAAIPASERADLAVLAPDSGRSPVPLVERWAARGPARPASVVLVDGAEVDPLASPFSHLDHTVPAGRVETELRTFAQTLGRAATAPPAVVILDPDAAPERGLAAALGAAGARVQVVSGGGELRALLARESPDLIAIEGRLPDTTAAALLRVVRRSSSHQVTPIVVYASDISGEDRVAAIRAGADDVLLKSLPLDQAVRILLARVDRSRQAQALAHRDDLTGLRTHAALLDELESATSYAQRAGETFALILLDLDHFRRVNELHGHSAGDRVLAGLAQAVGAMVRATDVLARVGGEEFGILARRCAPEHAGLVAERFRRAIGELAVEADGATIRLRASAGLARYPANGASAVELLRAAEAALARAKTSGRDRVVAA